MVSCLDFFCTNLYNVISMYLRTYSLYTCITKLMKSSRQYFTHYLVRKSKQWKYIYKYIDYSLEKVLNGTEQNKQKGKSFEHIFNIVKTHLTNYNKMKTKVTFKLIRGKLRVRF